MTYCIYIQLFTYILSLRCSIPMPVLLYTTKTKQQIHNFWIREPITTTSLYKRKQPLRAGLQGGDENAYNANGGRGRDRRQRGRSANLKDAPPPSNATDATVTATPVWASSATSGTAVQPELSSAGVFCHIQVNCPQQYNVNCPVTAVQCELYSHSSTV